MISPDLSQFLKAEDDQGEDLEAGVLLVNEFEAEELKQGCSGKVDKCCDYILVD